MLWIALKRLGNRTGLTLLSIAAVTLGIGLAVSIPVFAKAVSFVMLREELDYVSRLSRRPAFSMRVYVLPGTQYTLSTERARAWEEHLTETILTEVGLPLSLRRRQMETLKLPMRTRDELTDYGPAQTVLIQDASLMVLPGAESRLKIVDGRPMSAGPSADDILDVWIHHTTATQLGLNPGEAYEVYDSRHSASIPIRIAGTWRAADPSDPFWFQNPDQTLRRTLLVRQEDYVRLAEPVLKQQIGFASWYLILDDSLLTAENMRAHSDGLRAAQRVIEKYIPDARIDGSPLSALETSLKRESDLTVLMFAFSVPVMGFLLYFLGLISTITLRWQQRETAVMVSRGMRSDQLLAVSTVEAGTLIGLGLPLGLLTGVQLARAMGHTESFMRFTWRAPLPVSTTALNVPMLVATIGALFLARLLPVLRSVRTGVVAHERRRARAPEKPFWQRFYLDFLLLVPLVYAHRQLRVTGTLVPGADTTGRMTTQDPLLFLVPALFTLALSLLMIRLFPFLMRFGDWLSTLGRQATLYLAFRQLARQSGQYISALLLVVTSLSLGGFMASMADSLDQWLLDQVYYEVGTDVLIRQMLDPEYVEAGLIPPSGAWMLPIESYLDLPGVIDAARVGMYEASIQPEGQRAIRGTFMGVDRLDLPDVLFFRPDFAVETLGGLMNQLAVRADGVLVSERFMQEMGLQIGDKIPIRVVLVDVILSQILVSADFVVVGSYRYFPTVYEQGENQTAVIGNLDHLFERVGGPEIHHIWLRIEPEADKRALIGQVQEMGVFIKDWVEAREMIAFEQSRAERVGIFGTLTIGFLAAAVFSGIGLLIYNYASLQERLFRFTILRAVGLSLVQVISQVAIEYTILMVYSVAGGAAIGVWASRVFIPFFQAADGNVLRPPTMVPLIAWQDIGRISGAFVLVLVLAQILVVAAALRGGVFQALRMGDRE